MPCALARLSLVLGSLVLGSACGPMVVPDGRESDDESDDDTAGETAASTTTAATTSTSTSTSTTTPPDATTVGTTSPPDPTGGREPGYCAQTCQSAPDCGFGSPDFVCIDGFCEYIGQIPPCRDDTCPPELGATCGMVDGVSSCLFPCATDQACSELFGAAFVCTGVADDGTLYCQPPPCNGAVEGEPCDIPGFGQLGVCFDGLCVCTEDTQCTAMGFACNR
jgi:hypothetical protein